MPRCLVCGKKNFILKNDDNSYLILLNDSRYIHQSCLKKAEKKLNDLKIEIKNLSQQIDGYKSSFWNKLFDKSSDNINNLEERFNSKKNSYEKLHRGFDKVCIFYPGRPPDWFERSKVVKNRDGNKCLKCNSFVKLQAHHKIEINKGGSNSLENLITLCEECHLKEHHSKSFGGKPSQPNELSSFHEKHKYLKYCIGRNLEINFNYWKWKKTRKKWSKEISKRHIRPNKIDTIKDGLKMVKSSFLKNDGAGYFVYGYDFDRKAERFFDISKMSKIKKIH